MVLMKPGCWHDTAWADRTWFEDLWLEYGTAVPSGGDSSRYYYVKPSENRESQRKDLLNQVKKLMEAFM
jgi:hypothetical protein